jgi:Uma2 family endonuclease
MSEPAKKMPFTYADYLADVSNDRYELLDGKIVMQAAPSSVHQEISMELSRQFANYLVGKKCRVYHAPFDVRLFEKEGDSPNNVYTVFQPDISVVCDRKKIDNRGCKGAPDLVIEILSPSTAGRDWISKLNQYRKAGVREYWIVDPQNQLVHVFLLKDGQFFLCKVYSKTETAEVNVLDGCSIDLNQVFPEQTEN